MKQKDLRLRKVSGFTIKSPLKNEVWFAFCLPALLLPTPKPRTGRYKNGAPDYNNKKTLQFEKKVKAIHISYIYTHRRMQHLRTDKHETFSPKKLRAFVSAEINRAETEEEGRDKIGR